MNKKKKLIVGNWKMHLNAHDASILVHRLEKHLHASRNVEVVIAPSFLTLQPLSREIDKRKLKLASQGGYQKDEGAFTGEVSFTMMQDLVEYSIIGHSERRIYFNESHEDIRDKVQAAIRNGIKPILCVGETGQERAVGETKRVIHDQVTSALSNLTSEDIHQVAIAYEPVWAISTFGGEVAKPSDIESVINIIRHNVSELYGEAAAQEVKVLYGGSVNPDVARSYLEIQGCDGALVGGASLNYKQFVSIVECAQDLSREDHSR